MGDMIDLLSKEKREEKEVRNMQGTEIEDLLRGWVKLDLKEASLTSELKAIEEKKNQIEHDIFFNSPPAQRLISEHLLSMNWQEKEMASVEGLRRCLIEIVRDL